MVQNEESVYQRKQSLRDEYRVLSSYVEKETATVAALRGGATASWLLTAAAFSLAGDGCFARALQAATLEGDPPFMPATAMIGAIVAFWSVDLFCSYYGAVYKGRLTQVRQWLRCAPSANAAEVLSWQVPANPFDGLDSSNKLRALKSTALSPAVSGTYVILALTTVWLYW